MTSRLPTRPRFPTYYVSRCAREAVTVALTGDAGDEAFAGYDRYRAAQLAARFDALPSGVRGMLAGLGRLLPRGEAKSRSRRLYRFLTVLGESPARRYLSWMNVLTPAQLLAGYTPEFAGSIAFDEPLGWFDRLYREAAGGVAERAVLSDYQSYLPFDLLTKVDIASMACGLECRAPLLDHELVEFALSLPIGWRMGKRILKDWAADLLPADLLNRPKMGFGVPIGEWFRDELRELLEARLFERDALCLRVFDAAWLRRFVDEHLSARHNHAHALWALLVLELWRARWRPRVA